jgi:hypothetical protein
LISVVAISLSRRGGYRIYLCRANTLSVVALVFDGVRWGDDGVGPFHGALVTGKPNRGSGGLPRRDLSSQCAGARGYRRTQCSAPAPSLVFNGVAVGLWRRALHVRGAAGSRISGAYDAEIARIDLGNHAFGEDFALRQG